MDGDPLSDVVALSGARCLVTHSMEVVGAWHFRFAAPAGIKFVAITSGDCWLAVDGSEPRSLRTGDVFMLRGGHAFAMATDLRLPPTNGNGVFTDIAPSGDAVAFSALCGHIDMERAGGNLLLDALPPLIVMDRSAPAAAVTGSLLHQLVDEFGGAPPGRSLALAQLAQLIFVHLIRAHIATRQASPLGWIAALSDDRIARALGLLHASPSRAWKVHELAAQVGLSRTTFATRFSAALGTGPIGYLGEWRLGLGERELRGTTRPIAAVAHTLGFASTSAFASAFRRKFGMSPKQYRVGLSNPRP